MSQENFRKFFNTSSVVFFLQSAQHTTPRVPTLQRGNAEPDAPASCRSPECPETGRWSVYLCVPTLERRVVYALDPPRSISRYRHPK
ncbi:MAG: hypothetical protein GY801_51450 [bacterium]|nr:hypothetical protein [bacterium]